MTIEELRARIADEFASLSGDNLLDENPAILETLLREAEDYIKAYFSEPSEEIERMLIPTFVMFRLLERKGYGELSERYWNRLTEEISRLLEKEKSAASESRIVISSSERIFTNEEFAKW